MKRHDCNVFMERLIPIVLKKLERIFPRSFFDVMELLMVHLSYEARRYMNHLKKKIKNKARVEGSICNAYLVEEAVIFYSYYFEPHISTKARDPPRNDEGDQPRDGESSLSICNGQGRLLKYTMELRTRFPGLTKNDVHMRMGDEFSMWFSEEMVKLVNASNSKCLSAYHGEKGSSSLTNNYGVRVKGDYHAVLNEIIEVRYAGRPSQSVILFKCDWFDSHLTRGLKIHDINLWRCTFVSIYPRPIDLHL
ncbi:hypothetical protein M9H77_17746 [Catharanthus roseus]|uniref:Uncharacterized protein n=1 Tax=Catharanthus roseus TaxID=4058 RepID=A0ACC0B5G8_CATRO|nr:hypothetical protein M9H77_17746 [Catharanthus roseus]